MNLSEITALPPAARAQHYRALAEKARGDASEANDSEYISYLIMAEEWERLALLADKEAAARAAK